MDGLSRRRIGFLAGIAFTTVSLLALLSFAPQDPTLTNLRYPKDGVANLLGYPGALLAGSLVEGLGWAALLLPGAVLYWTLCTAGRPRGRLYAVQTGALLLVASSWSGQWADAPGLGLGGPGGIGWLGGQWTRELLGPEASGIALTLGLALALWQQGYAPALRAAVPDLRRLGRLFTSEGWREAAAWLRERAERVRAVDWVAWGRVVLSPALVLVWVAAVAVVVLTRGVAEVLANVWERFGGGAASLRGTRFRAEGGRLFARPMPLAAAAARSFGERAFDDWLEPEPPRGAAESAAAAPAPQPSAATGLERLAEASRAVRQEQEPAAAPFGPAGSSASGAERWEHLLRRYRENLDLDWDERSWHTPDDPGARRDPGGKAAPRRPK